MGMDDILASYLHITRDDIAACLHHAAKPG
jgi:uncharacterized protein (DUF433 family)